MLKNFISFINDNKLDVYDILIHQGGRLAAEHHFASAERRNLYSVTKSITSAAVGIAIEEGHFSLKDTLLELFAEELPENLTSEHLNNLNQITVERLLTMSVRDYPFARLSCDNWLWHILSIPLPHADQRTFRYNNFTAYLAGVIVEKRTGIPMERFLRLHIFEPLAIPEVAVAHSPEGYYYGSTGMKLTAEELSRVGQLLLQKGNWNGKQLIPEAWVEQATTKQIENKEEGYGYYFWMQKNNSYCARGKWGQLLAVFPEKEAVVTILSNLEEASKENQMYEGLLKLVYPLL